METGLPWRLTYQKVQPLQAGAPCTAAPTAWIEPREVSLTSEPSARPLAHQRPPASNITSPGAIRPCSTKLPHGTRGSRRFSAGINSAGSSIGVTAAMRGVAKAAAAAANKAAAGPAPGGDAEGEFRGHPGAGDEAVRLS